MLNIPEDFSIRVVGVERELRWEATALVQPGFGCSKRIHHPKSLGYIEVKVSALTVSQPYLGQLTGGRDIASRIEKLPRNLLSVSPED